MQAETVASLAGRESVIEDAGEILGGNTDPVVRHTDPDAITEATGAQRDRCIRPAGFHTGLFRVADEIDENLQCLVLIDIDNGGVAKVADDVDPVEVER